MPRLIKILGYTAAAIVAVAATASTVVYLGSNAHLKKSFVVTPKAIPIPTDAAAIARGRHLAETRGCNDCHGLDFAGKIVIDDGAMGTLYAPNLTRGDGGRAGRFSDEDWVRAIRHGVGPDQRGLFLMPSEEYVHFSDEDLGAIIAYLKTVPAIDRARVPISLGPISRMLLATGKMKLAAETIDHPNVNPQSVQPGVTVEYGRYVAKGCIGCHGPNLSGGKIPVGPPNWPDAANLTPHPDGHLAKWTEDDFMRAIREAKRPDGSELNPVMPRVFAHMNDTELQAIWKYLETLPAVPTGVR